MLTIKFNNIKDLEFKTRQIQAAFKVLTQLVPDFENPLMVQAAPIHRAGRPLGTKLSPKTRAKMRRSALARWAALKGGR